MIDKGVISGMARGVWQDPRLRPLHDNAECFLCGHIIVRPTQTGVQIEFGPSGTDGIFMGSLPMSCHSMCVEGMEIVELMVRYRRALSAALKGSKEDA